jgi:epoxyqueuosine reductase
MNENQIFKMSLDSELVAELKSLGIEFYHFVDISQLPNEQNKHYPNAILFGITLSPGYLQKIISNPDYVQDIILNNQTHEDEFDIKEALVNNLADHIADWLKTKGYSAYSQSENNIAITGFYDQKNQCTPLPHKTIARLAGMGWIGKHNLLITPEYGSAISICSVLTDAPLKTVLHTPANSSCRNCSICKEACDTEAIKGNTWDPNTSRDCLVDISKCTTCMKCLVFCPWTIAYMKRNV